MIAKLPNDLSLELDRNGNRPLAVEDPRTHKRYVIVPADEFLPGSQVGAAANSSGDWTEEKNARRFALIDKEIAGQITPTEAADLACLQREMDEHLRQVAPLPLDEVRALHEQLVRQSLGDRS